MSLEPASLTQLVLAGGFLIGALFGATAFATRFCTMGAIGDILTFGDATRLRLWVWAALVGLLGTQALQQFGAAELSASIHLQPRVPWLSHALGGLLFGFGMVLASGCPSRALVRAGSGSLKALIVLLIVGVTAQMTLRGVLAVPRVELLDRVALQLAGPQDLPALLARAGGVAPGTLRWVVCGLIAVPLLVWLARGREFMRAGPLVGGLLIGSVVVGAWWLSGGLGFLVEHPETLEPAWLATHSRRPEALSFVAPTAYTLDLLTLWSDNSTRLSFGVATLTGTLLGSLAAALARREFRIEAFRDAPDLGRHVLGATLMGVGGVAAVGCSIGQGLSGVSLLSLGSLVAVAAMVLGAIAALRYLEWRMG